MSPVLAKLVASLAETSNCNDQTRTSLMASKSVEKRLSSQQNQATKGRVECQDLAGTGIKRPKYAKNFEVRCTFDFILSCVGSDSTLIPLARLFAC
jgi:hypothetical protein